MSKKAVAVWGSASSGVAPGAVRNHEDNNCPHSDEGPCARCALEELDTADQFRAVSLNDVDVEACVRKLSASQRDMLILSPEELIIAGGFVRSVIARERIRDVDYFTPKEANAVRLKDAYIRWEGLPAKNATFSSEAITITHSTDHPIQLIYRHQYTDPSEVLKMFDLTVSQAAFWYGKDGMWRGMCSSRFYEDLAAKRLVCTAPDRNDLAPGLLVRLLKHVELGYTVPKEQCARAVAIMIGSAQRTVPAETMKDPEKLEAALYQQMMVNQTSPEFTRLSKPSISSRAIATPPERHDWGGS